MSLDLDDFARTVAERVKAAREVSGQSQSVVERAADVPPTTVARMERGEAGQMAVRDLAAVLGALGVDMRELLPPGEPPYHIPRTEL